MRKLEFDANPFQNLPWEFDLMQQSHRREGKVWIGNGGDAEWKPLKMG